MAYPKYLLFELAGGLIWSATFVLLGWFLGAQWRALMERYGVGSIIIAVVAITVVGAAAIVAVRLMRRSRHGRPSFPARTAADVAPAGPDGALSSRRATPSPPPRPAARTSRACARRAPPATRSSSIACEQLLQHEREVRLVAGRERGRNGEHRAPGRRARRGRRAARSAQPATASSSASQHRLGIAPRLDRRAAGGRPSPAPAPARRSPASRATTARDVSPPSGGAASSHRVAARASPRRRSRNCISTLQR